MAEPMNAERFLDRWQNYRDQPQQVFGIRALHAAIASLEGGAQILDEQAPWARQFSQKPSPPKPKSVPDKKGVGAVALALPFFDQTNDGPDGWRHCQSSSIAMNLAYLGVAGIKDDLHYLKVVQPPLPGKMTPLQPDHIQPPGGLMEQSNASLQRDDQS